MMKARRVFGVLLLAAGVMGAQAQNETGSPAVKPAKAHHKTPAELEQDVQNLTEKYEKLEQEMQQFKAEAVRREAELKSANKLALTAQAEAEAAAKQEKLRAESTLETVAK